jgi:hypothetical protein
MFLELYKIKWRKIFFFLVSNTQNQYQRNNLIVNRVLYLTKKKKIRKK